MKGKANKPAQSDSPACVGILKDGEYFTGILIVLGKLT